MQNFFGGLFFGVRDLLNGINNTVWGVFILFWAMYILTHHQDTSAAAYYFAGVASTLLGIKQDHPQTTNFNNSSVSTPGPLNSSVTNSAGDTDAKS